ncbi:MAG: hypothetical protein BA863_12060 [Desulfovibrio sp. S3730MH75]|nr:MAG: hypothetical protein BA863_12060 [Desulfovibrio sp. S3730MH75]
MNVLGVCNANVSGATLIIDGEVVASVNEERFTRVKNQRAFPEKSIQYCLEYSGLSVCDVDYVACGAWAGISDDFIPQCVDEVMDFCQKDENSRKMISERTRVAVERDLMFKQELIDGLGSLGFARERLSFYDHHLSHAATAFYPSPFDEALVVTVDGRGDFKSSTVYRGSRAEGLVLLDSTSMYNSLGAFYGFVTKYLGFTPDKHEGKVTGLAAYGDVKACYDLLSEMIAYENKKIVANLGSKYTPFLSGNLPYIEERLRNHSKEDISAAAQYILEEIVTAYIKDFVDETGLRNIALSGGVFGNVKLNQRIQEIEGVENIYVFPQMGDGGNAFGGALLKLYEVNGSLNGPLEHVYLGPSYSCDEILSALARYKEQVEVVSLEQYTIGQVAKDLDDGVVVGLFTGRMEYGPRALGARSILASAKKKEINDILNARLNRSEFMPFAPVTLLEKAEECYVGWRPENTSAQFMTTCYDCTVECGKATPAVVHVDNTARPQLISRDMNPLYYDILKSYYDQTGIPTFVNTSFNNHEEPIVCSPDDAIKSLLIDNVDYLVLEGYVVKRRTEV